MKLRKWLCRVFGHPDHNLYSINYTDGRVEHICGRCLTRRVEGNVRTEGRMYIAPLSGCGDWVEIGTTSAFITVEGLCCRCDALPGDAHLGLCEPCRESLT